MPDQQSYFACLRRGKRILESKSLHEIQDFILYQDAILYLDVIAECPACGERHASESCST